MHFALVPWGFLHVLQGAEGFSVFLKSCLTTLVVSMTFLSLCKTAKILSYFGGSVSSFTDSVSLCMHLLRRFVGRSGAWGGKETMQTGLFVVGSAVSTESSGGNPCWRRVFFRGEFSFFSFSCFSHGLFPEYFWRLSGRSGSCLMVFSHKPGFICWSLPTSLMPRFLKAPSSSALTSSVHAFLSSSFWVLCVFSIVWGTRKGQVTLSFLHYIRCLLRFLIKVRSSHCPFAHIELCYCSPTAHARFNSSSRCFCLTRRPSLYFLW